MSATQANETLSTDILIVGGGIAGTALAARLAPLGPGRMGLTGMTRFTREKAIVVRRNEALGIDSLDERLLQ